MAGEAVPNREIALSQKNSGKDGRKTPREISESFFISNYIGYIVEVYSIFCISFLFYNFKKKKKKKKKNKKGTTTTTAKKVTNIQLASCISIIINDHHYI